MSSDDKSHTVRNGGMGHQKGRRLSQLFLSESGYLFHRHLTFNQRMLVSDILPAVLKAEGAPYHSSQLEHSFPLIASLRPLAFPSRSFLDLLLPPTGLLLDQNRCSFYYHNSSSLEVRQFFQA
jgi:hypothetical protein